MCWPSSRCSDSLSQEKGAIGNCDWIRDGKQVVICGYCSTTAAGTTTIGTMPDRCRPASYCAAPTASNGYAEIGRDGVLKMVARGGGANYFTMCYPCV